MILLNQTHLNGRDISTYYSNKKNKLGITLIAGLNTQEAQDINGNSFADVPEYNRATISPKIFYTINNKNNLTIGLSSSIEDRTGGDIRAIRKLNDSTHTFVEENKTKRINSRLKYEHISSNGNIITLKTLISNYSRDLNTNINNFSGTQNTIYSELSYFSQNIKHKWVSGINYYYDSFNQNNSLNKSLDYTNNTIGFFSQDNWQLSKKIFLEPGVRYDYIINYGNYILPRLAILYKITPKIFVRLSGGLGYKLPTIFTDEAERTRFQNIYVSSSIKVEKSSTINIDLNYKTQLADELFLSINQSIFITQVDNPIIANKDSLNNHIIYNQNTTGSLIDKGFNTNIRLSLDELILYFNYTYIDTKKTYDNNKPLELTPQNKITTTLAYEDEEEGWKTAVEAFYFGNQHLESGKKNTKLLVDRCIGTKNFRSYYDSC